MSKGNQEEISCEPERKKKLLLLLFTFYKLSTYTLLRLNRVSTIKILLESTALHEHCFQLQNRGGSSQSSARRTTDEPRLRLGSVSRADFLYGSGSDRSHEPILKMIILNRSFLY